MSKLDLQKIVYFEFSADLAKFALSYFFSIIINGNFYLCPGMGANNDAVDLTIAFALSFLNCYKEVIKDLCDFSSSWSGIEAKYIDECEDSEEAPVELHTWNYYNALEDNIHKGTVYPLSDVYCHPLPGIKAVAAGD